MLAGIDPTKLVRGRGHHKTTAQRQYEKLTAYTVKLKEHAGKTQTSGTGRSSYSKTDHDATFMRMKRDCMGNDRLLPAYNIRLGITDENIAMADVMH